MEPVGPMREQRSRWHRFLDWTTNHTLLVAILFDFVIIVATLAGFQHYNDANIARAKVQAIHEAKERSDALAASQLDVCRRAVAAVTDQLNADLLKVVKGVEDRFTEQGRPVPSVYLQLELLINNRQPPLAACEPKENP